MCGNPNLSPKLGFTTTSIQNRGTPRKSPKCSGSISAIRESLKAICLEHNHIRVILKGVLTYVHKKKKTILSKQKLLLLPVTKSLPVL